MRNWRGATPLLHQARATTEVSLMHAALQWFKLPVTMPRWTALALPVVTVLLTVTITLGPQNLYQSLTQPPQIKAFTTWAMAIQNGDLATAHQTMLNSGLSLDFFDSETLRLQQAGRLGMYHVIKTAPMGQSLQVTLDWQPASSTSALDRLCMRVQVSPDRKVLPVELYHPCTAQELENM